MAAMGAALLFCAVERARPSGNRGEKVLIALLGLFAQSNTFLYS